MYQTWSEAYKLVTGDQHMEGSILIIADLFLVPELAQRRSIFYITPIREGLQLGNEASDFLLPVMECGRWGDDEERSPDIVRFRKISEQ